jgi:hypothetical protein
MKIEEGRLRLAASPDLIWAFCRTPYQMALANALCRSGR